MAKIRDYCTTQVVTATRDTTVGEAARLMRQHHVGTIIVCDQANGERRIPVGIVTDRDIVVELVAADLGAGTIAVGEIMGPRLVTVGESEDILTALGTMRQEGVRRLPVVSGDGSLVGVVSSDDLMRALPAELSDTSMIVARAQFREAARRQ